MCFSVAAVVPYVCVLVCVVIAGPPCARSQESALNAPDPHLSTDPEERRLVSNARYIQRPVHTKVTQQFEMYDPHSEGALHDLKSMGFTQVVLDWPNLHHAATDAGLNVVLANWWTLNTSDKDIDAGIARARNVAPKKLIGFSIMDEPGRNAPETPFTFYEELYSVLEPVFREQFPTTRLEISHWGPMATWTDQHYEKFSHLYQAADVMRIMPYPDLYEAPLDDVFFMIQRSRRLMEIAGVRRPLVVILQAWVLPPKNKLPEIDELRVMAYQTMLSGAETLSFFEYNLDVWNRAPGFQVQFRQLMAELTQFSRANRESSVETMIDSKGILTTRLTPPRGSHLRVLINTRRTRNRDMDPLEVRMTKIPEHRGSRLALKDTTCGITELNRCVTQRAPCRTSSCTPSLLRHRRCSNPTDHALNRTTSKNNLCQNGLQIRKACNRTR